MSSLVLSLAVAELLARAVEPAVTFEGNERPLPDPVIGWLPRPGVLRVATSEFAATYDVNALGMNDRPIDVSDRQIPVRILAVGDSFTYGVGVSQPEAWPLVLDGLLFDRTREAGRVFNGGVPGYNLGQYLQRFRMLEPILRPQLVLVGVSTATDLFDLLPPRLGGFVFGDDAPREYFDFDADGRLVERRFTPDAAADAPRSTGLAVRERLRRFALYRSLQNSMLLMRFATSLRLPGSDPMWEGPDALLRRELTEKEQFQWRLASAIVRRFVTEARAAGASVALVVIPYLPEVYDDLWNATFGRSRGYDRFIGSRRLADIAMSTGASVVDTTPAFVAEARRSGRWLHYRIDKHPTAEGHRIIASEVARFVAAQQDLAGAVSPVRTTLDGVE